MPPQSQNQQVRQRGEDLIVAELRTRGLTATPFKRNLLISNMNGMNGRTIPIWFKAIKGESWQFYIDRFLNVGIEGDRQVVYGKKTRPDPMRICIFVQIESGTNGSDGSFYIFREHELQDFFQRTYKGRTRPLDITSYHCAIWPKDLEQHRNRWDLVEEALGQKKTS